MERKGDAHGIRSWRGVAVNKGIHGQPVFYDLGEQDRRSEDLLQA